MPRPPITDHGANFLSKVKKTESCWLWLGCIGDRGGYGAYAMDGRKINAHCAAYILFIGQIPLGKQVLHSCDNPPCVNPNHLFIGTQGDNLKDRNTKGRANLKGCKKPSIAGPLNPQSKLTAEQVTGIKAYQPSFSDTEVARLCGVNRGVVWNIRH